jgi:hypothetical protein
VFLTLPAFAQDAVTNADWPHYGGTQFSWRYSSLDQINSCASPKPVVGELLKSRGDRRLIESATVLLPPVVPENLIGI